MRLATCGASAIVASALLVSPAASAKVQNSAQWQAGVVGVGAEGKAWQSTRMDLGLRFESVWFRESPRDFGIGPYVETRTAWFDHADYGGGLVAVIPTNVTFPLWIGGGAFARRQEGTWASGGNAFLGWGGRSFNYDSSYAMTYGLLFDVRVHRGDYPGVDFVLAATIDLEGLALPFLYGFSALRH